MIEPGFYLGDCMDYLKDMPDKSIDLAVCDPPYGINVGKASMGMGGGKAPHRNRSARRAAGTNNTSHSAASATRNVGGGENRRGEALRKQSESGASNYQPQNL